MQANEATRASRVAAWSWVTTTLLACMPLAFAVALGSGVPLWHRAIALGVVAAAAWQPARALIALAVLAPLGAVIGVYVGASVGATEWLVPAVLLGGAIGAARGHANFAAHPVLTTAALVLAGLSLVSVAVHVAAEAPLYASAAAWRQAVFDWLTGYYHDPGPFPFGAAGVRLAQQALLVPLAAAVLGAAGSPLSLVPALVAGGGVVAALNVNRLFEVAARTGDWSAGAMRLAGSLRISAAFPDLNAAGSLLALMLALAAGLAFALFRERRRAAAVGVSGVTVLLAASLWLTGSRVALAALPLGAILVAAIPSRGSPWWTWRRFAVGAVAVVATVGMIWVGQARRSSNDAPLAWLVRVEFVKTTWRMLEDHPVFGVGSGRYHRVSASYVTPRLRIFYPRENAHNNFLQVLGELGPAGLLAFLALVGIPVVGLASVLRDSPVRDGRAAGLLWGLMVFLLTCFGGHPLLVPEVAAPAFLALGAAAACGAPSRSRIVQNLSATVAIAAAVALVATVPWRVEAARASLDLEHVLPGGERWVRDDGFPQVTFTGDVSVYVPGAGQRAVVTLRSADAGQRPVEVTFWLDGRRANVLRLSSGDWIDSPLLVPSAGSRFRLLRLEARWADGGEGFPRVQLRRIESPR